MSRKTAKSEGVRLQKFLSDAGVASRRHAEELIGEGRVLVNGRVVDTLPAFIDPQRDRVVVDGVGVRIQRREYYLVHKPKGVVCTNWDPAGRKRAVDLLPPMKTRLFVVGRLDADSTGLLLMTNDGELAERVTHPRYGMPKEYRAEVRGAAETDLPERLRKGVHLSEGKVTASEVEIVHRSRQRTILRIILREGRNRQVRRMLARLGHPVKKLKRTQIGPLSLRRLPVGGVRPLTPRELAALRESLAERGGRSKPGRRPRKATKQPKRAATPKRKAAPTRGKTTMTPAKRPRRKPKAAEPTGRKRRLIS